MAAAQILNVEEAAELLVAGRLVAFPTETVYGLGADASNAAAVDAVFTLKGRPRGHPLIVHLAAGVDPAHYFAREVPELAYLLMQRFWPGPLTLVLKRQTGHGLEAAAGQDSIGLRCPAHGLAQQLLQRVSQRKADAGVAAPSANRFGRVSPTTAAHVLAEFGAAVAVLDGGACPLGIESTIVDLTRIDGLGAVLLRPGSVTRDMLAEVIGAAPLSIDAGAPRASGTLAAHYAPTKMLALVPSAALGAVAADVAVWAFVPPPAGSLRRAPWLIAPCQPEAYAQQLYAVLRQLDQTEASAIAFEAPPQGAAWEGVNDRLRRAAAAS